MTEDQVYTADDITASLLRICSKLLSVNKRDLNKVIVRVAGKPAIHTRLQSLFNIRFGNTLDQSLYELIMIHATAAERLGPGGFTRCIELLLEKSEQTSGSNPQEKLNVAFPTVPTSSDVARLVELHGSTGGKRTTAMLTEALKLAGFGGRIIIEKTSSSVPSVELVRGYTFELMQLLPIDVNFIKPRVVCIDGYIEDVAEIHHLLEAASSAKEPCMLFLRGMSEDVKHTLKVNYDRGSLRIIPVGVRFDLDGMNTLVDIAVTANSDVVSSLKGDLISNIKFHELPYVDQCTVYKGRVVVTNTSSHKAVGNHVSQLRKRRAEERVEDVGTLLDKRIKSLSPNHVIIRLPDDKDFVTNSQAIDYALRAVRSMVDYGVTSTGDLVTTEIAARVHANRCLATLTSVGAFVKVHLAGSLASNQP